MRRGKLVLAFTDPLRSDWHWTPRSLPGLSFAAALGTAHRH
ncbi:MAG TPA: hypothetical protein VLW55_08905 [Burkholderiaceae bacterium]|nr:hypothetical protein [Burkholderiaceae bacterium]